MICSACKNDKPRIYSHPCPKCPQKIVRCGHCEAILGREKGS